MDILLKSPSKDFVKELFQTSFTCGKGSVPLPIQEKCAGVLEVTTAEIGAMFVQMGVLIQSVLFEGVTTKEGLLAVIPEALDSGLKSLIIKIVAANLSTWRDLSSNNELSLPALKDFDWRIDIKTSSDKVSRMSVPTALVQMKIEDVAMDSNQIAPMRAVNFEVSKETISTMLDGMGKILEQLNSVAE